MTINNTPKKYKKKTTSQRFKAKHKNKTVGYMHDKTIMVIT